VKRALALLLVGMMATAGVAQASEVVKKMKESVDAKAAVAEAEKKETTDSPLEVNRAASIWELYCFADSTDKFYMLLGLLGSLVTGLCIPAFNILFGRIINALNSNPNSFNLTINTLCEVFCGVAAVNLFSGFFPGLLFLRCG